MNAPASPTAAITRCPQALERAALELVFATLPEDLRVAHVGSLLAGSDEKPLDGLLVRGGETSIEAAIFVEPQPGCVASFWGPAFAAESTEKEADTAAALIAAGRTWAESREIQLAQTLLTGAADRLAGVYCDAGFSIRAELDYLICDVRYAERPCEDHGLELVNCTPADREALAAVIDKTYEGTRDCPELNGARDMQHVLDGYAAAGDSAEQHWYLVRRAGETVGVLLLAEHMSQDQAELVYMGVLPSARGCGYGQILTQMAQYQTHVLGHPRIILAVDTRNQPALDHYHGAGFTLFDRRTALLSVLTKAP